MLLALCDVGREVGLDSTVICLAPPGPVSGQLLDIGIPVTHIGLTSIWQFPIQTGAIKRELRKSAPDVVQGWMYHGNIAALMAGRGTGAPIVWNVRQSLHRTDLFKRTTRLMIRANASVSGHADMIIYNSEVARRQHEELGFAKAGGALIPNGVDLVRFGAGHAGGAALRDSLGIPEDAIVFIAVGRANAIKGHDLLLRAAREVSKADVPVRFLVVGEGTSWNVDPYIEFAGETGVRRIVTLAGGRDDVPELLSMADVFVSSSRTEGFPNAVAEAMASGVPCLVTDVGDSSALVGDAGLVIPASDAGALVQGILDLAGRSTDELEAIGQVGMHRIQSEFSIRAMAAEYAGHYRSLVS
jgi:glycosyltransferase involved in cell wall biosynthesis